MEIERYKSTIFENHFDKELFKPGYINDILRKTQKYVKKNFLNKEARIKWDIDGKYTVKDENDIKIIIIEPHKKIIK